MLPGLTLDRRGETGKTKAAWQIYSSMQGPGRFRREARSPPVKGGIAHPRLSSTFRRLCAQEGRPVATSARKAGTGGCPFTSSSSQ